MSKVGFVNYFNTYKGDTVVALQTVADIQGGEECLVTKVSVQYLEIEGEEGQRERIEWNDAYYNFEFA